MHIWHFQKSVPSDPKMHLMTPEIRQLVNRVLIYHTAKYEVDRSTTVLSRDEKPLVSTRWRSNVIFSQQTTQNISKTIRVREKLLEPFDSK